MGETSDEGKIPTLDGIPVKFDLAGPTIDDDVQRLIWRYGANALKESVKRLTKPKKGRKPEKDWPDLRDIIEEDARIWLAGDDPFAIRTDYAVAKIFTERNPGHSAISTHARIERKLKKPPYNRRWFMLVTAEQFGKEGYPHAAYLRTLEALKATGTGDAWESMLQRAHSDIATYEVKFGSPPSHAASIAEIEKAARNALMAFVSPTASAPKVGLLGTFSSDDGEDT